MIYQYMTKILQVSINDKRWVNIFKKSLERQRKHEGGDSSYASIIRDSILLREQWVFDEGEFSNNPHHNEVKALSIFKKEIIESIHTFITAEIIDCNNELRSLENMIWCRRKYPRSTEKKVKEARKICKTQLGFLNKFRKELKLRVDKI